MAIFQNLTEEGEKKEEKKAREKESRWGAEGGGEQGTTIGQFQDCVKKNEKKSDTILTDAASGAGDFYSRKQIQTVIKPRFHRLLCWF